MQEWFTEWNSDQRQEFFRSINQADSDLNAMVENLQLDDLHVQVDHLVEEPQMNGHIEDSVLATLVTTAARRTELSSPAKESPLPSPQTSPKTKVEQTSDENPPENLSGDEEILWRQ